MPKIALNGKFLNLRHQNMSHKKHQHGETTNTLHNSTQNAHFNTFTTKTLFWKHQTNPIFKFRYKWLDRKLPGTAKKTIVKKVLLDQFIPTPILLVLFFTGKNPVLFFPLFC
jgi:hypothetical protein